MVTAPLNDDLAREALRAYEENGKNKVHAARSLGISRSTFRNRLDVAMKRGLSAHYVFNEGDEKSDKEAWDEHRSVFERKIAKQRNALDNSIIHRDGPFVIAHFTDVHVDDDASALSLLESDIEASHRMGAIMCHGGDALNNWPMAGKLAKQWAEQNCTLPDALKRAKYYISILKPDVWTDGNHEEMNPYLMNMFNEWLPSSTIRDYWRVDFTVQVPGCDPFRVAMSHKFQKGSSWFHGLHGHLREMLESEERNLYMDGHYHIAGVMRHYLPERDHSALLVASAGYKMIDKWASRISRGGKEPKIEGRCHWIVVDPREPFDAVAFTNHDLASSYLNALTSRSH